MMTDKEVGLHQAWCRVLGLLYDPLGQVVAPRGTLAVLRWRAAVLAKARRRRIRVRRLRG